MPSRVLVAALVLALVVVGVFAPATAKPAAACSFGVPSDHVSALNAATIGSEIVIVGEVIHERTIERVVFSGEAHESTIRVVVALKGSPEREITLSPLGFLGADCSGGPRLPAGERVLLFLDQYGGEFHVYGYELGKYVLTEGEAKNFHFSPIPAEDFLRRLAAITDAPDDQLDAALAFAGVGPQPEPTAEIDVLPEVTEQGDGPPALLIGLGAAGVAVALLALVLGVRRLRRAR